MQPSAGGAAAPAVHLGGQAVTEIFSAELLRFFGFEYGCESIHSYGEGVINGLLQTPDYARAVIQSGGAYIRQAEVDRRVQARLVRQQRLTGPDPLALWW